MANPQGYPTYDVGLAMWHPHVKTGHRSHLMKTRVNDGLMCHHLTTAILAQRGNHGRVDIPRRQRQSATALLPHYNHTTTTLQPHNNGPTTTPKHGPASAVFAHLST